MLEEGTVVDGKYRIRRLVGEGGMGSVFEADAVRLHRRVAIKVLHSGLSNEAEVAARFQLEAQAAGRIGSRHIVDVLDLGQLASGAPYMVMEFLEGENLRERISRAGAMGPAQIQALALQLLEGVRAAHAARVIHRDLKPDNVFLVPQSDGTDFVKILDFGISKFSAGSDTPSELSLTRTSSLMGTPNYLSPEQANGSGKVDARTDLYAVGVILYECLTGALPYSAESFSELIFKIVLSPPVAASERVPDADPRFVAIVERAMRKQPNERFQTARDMALALEAWAGGRSFVAPEGADAQSNAGAHAGEVRPSSASFTPSAGTFQAPAAAAGLGTLESWSRGGSGGPSPLAPTRSPRTLVIWTAAAVSIGMCLAAALFWRASSRAAAPAAVAPSVTAALPTPVLGVAPQVTIAGSPNATDALDASGSSPPNSDVLGAPSPRPQRPLPSVPRSAATAHAPVVRAPVIGAHAPVPPPPAPARSDADMTQTKSGRTIRSDL